MNLFDYRRKKDLQGRTTEFRQSALSSNSGENRPGSGSMRPNNQPTARLPFSHRHIRSRTPDKWVYNTPLDNYRRKAQAGKPAANRGQLDEQQLKWRRLMPDWFTDEIIREVRRRHLVHILYIGKPAWLMLPPILLLFIISLFVPLLLIIAIPLLGLNLAFWAWYINDWSNDYLIITDRRFIQLEKVTLFNKAKIEIPLDKITEVKIETGRGPIEYLFKVGTVTVTSTGRSQITFKHVHDPESVRMEWDKLRKAYFMYRSNFRKDRMRNYLENRIWGSKLINWNEEEEAREIDVIENPNWLQRTFPTGPIRDRRKKQITWYTHPWVLFKRLSPLVLLLLLLILFGIFGLPFIYRLNVSLISLIGSAGFVLAFIGVCITIWYRYENWHNDRYVIGDEKVFDIEKLPFGFDETVGVIDIRNVQDIQFEKRGITANLLNYGSVKITTVGGPSITFERVPKPELIEDEVSRRKEILKFFDEERQDRLYADFFASYRDVIMNPPPEAEQPDEDGPSFPGNGRADPRYRV
jgi:membrane protein YdbS with pleckstrin-like domain